ncbi:MAG: hypothetical protein M3P30_09230 [Chloroflexota bacterium]|nr:hypothetical protein [Chloroflexota bacterium]
MEHPPDEQFRTLLWQKLVPLLGVPVFGALLVRAPITAGWSLTTWSVLGALVSAAIAIYLLRAWQQAKIVLNAEGLRMYVAGRAVIWPWQDLLNVKQVGRYRVRMCYDVGRDDGTHTHISIDLTDSDAFTDAMLDRYALSQGEELADDQSRAA